MSDPGWSGTRRAEDARVEVFILILRGVPETKTFAYAVIQPVLDNQYSNHVPRETTFA